MGHNPAVNARRYADKTRYLRAYKSEFGCRDCGERDPICLDFHHILPKNPKLYRSPGHMYSLQNLGWDEMVEETKKCVVLCRNCHAKETWGAKSG